MNEPADRRHPRSDNSREQMAAQAPRGTLQIQPWDERASAIFRREPVPRRRGRLRRMRRSLSSRGRFPSPPPPPPLATAPFSVSAPSPAPSSSPPPLAFLLFKRGPPPPNPGEGEEAAAVGVWVDGGGLLHPRGRQVDRERRRWGEGGADASKVERKERKVG